MMPLLLVDNQSNHQAKLHVLLLCRYFCTNTLVVVTERERRTEKSCKALQLGDGKARGRDVGKEGTTVASQYPGPSPLGWKSTPPTPARTPTPKPSCARICKTSRYVDIVRFIALYSTSTGVRRGKQSKVLNYH